jgi:hypothetical protein
MIAPTRRLGDVCILQHYEGDLVSLRETRISCPIDVRTLCRDRGSLPIGSRAQNWDFCLGSATWAEASMSRTKSIWLALANLAPLVRCAIALRPGASGRLPARHADDLRIVPRWRDDRISRRAPPLALR